MDFPATSGLGLPFDAALEFGVEAVLDGLAIAIAHGQTIADAKRILNPSPPEALEHLATVPSIEISHTEGSPEWDPPRWMVRAFVWLAIPLAAWAIRQAFTQH